MAVQFPNFLGVPIQKPDFSGLSDIFENYYRGKGLKHQDNMNQFSEKEAPLDLLLKQIQAEFARPNAETALTGAKLGNQGKSLSNRQTQMTIQKLQEELSNEAKFNTAMKAYQQRESQGAGAGGGMGMGGGLGGGMPMPMTQAPSMGGQALSSMSNAPQAPVGADAVRQQQHGTAFEKGLMDVLQQQAMKNQPMPTQAPILNDHPAGSMNRQETSGEPNQPTRQPIQELTPGNHAEHFVDKMWDDEPGMRPFLAKKGYKKDVKEVYDKQTGQTRITTHWPSGRRTVETVMPIQSKESLEGDIPLTKPVLNDAVKQIKGTDAVMPYLDKLIEKATPTKEIEKERDAYIKSKGSSLSPDDEKLKNYNAILEERKINYGLAGKASGGNDMPTFYWQPGNSYSSYKRLLQETKDKYLKATGLNNTDATLHTMEEIMARGLGESDAKYLRELKALKAAKIKEREENVRMVSKGLKRFSDFEPTPKGQSYSSNEYEVINE